jgi:hypothetical protein
MRRVLTRTERNTKNGIIIMKANELMIGDWVLHPYYKHPSKIVYFNGSRVRVEYEEVEAESLRPIPLTPEILEKNGWICEYFGRRQEWWLNKTKFPIVRYSTNDILHHNEIVLKYAHELQHALRLCGINREIII